MVDGRRHTVNEEVRMPAACGEQRTAPTCSLNYFVGESKLNRSAAKDMHHSFAQLSNFLNVIMTEHLIDYIHYVSRHYYNPR